jgi:murein DD-endopeptidase MepM/ murein hydrolase activator NlpD
MKKIKLFVLMAGLACINVTVADELPRHSAVPGGIALVPLASVTGPLPIVSYNDRRVMVQEKDGRRYAVVGISLDASPGDHTLQVVTGDSSRTQNFPVLSKEYTTQKITLKNQRMVTPVQQDLKRISSEIARARAVYGTWSSTPQVSFPLDTPVEGNRSGNFGLRRIFNGEPRRPHSGIDIAAPLGTEVRAPASGRVAEAGEFYFNGKTLFIDHGQGLITMYAHLSELDVKVGQEITRGQRIGKVGASGRATGPHLHWSVILNGVAVDPALLTAASND